jgi:hypothetical protein
MGCFPGRQITPGGIIRRSPGEWNSHSFSSVPARADFIQFKGFYTDLYTHISINESILKQEF